MPAVSVVIPTYNRAGRLEEALQSVFNQTYTDFECIVVDGGSTDETPKILDAIDDTRLHVITHDRPRGLSHARNVAIEHASGANLLFLDDDDRLYENAVEELVTTIRDHGRNCAAVYTARHRIDKTGNSHTIGIPEGRVDRFADAKLGGPSCTLVRAEVFDDIGLFDESFQSLEDVEFWVRLFAEYHMIGLDRVLYERHLHDGQMTADPRLMLEGRLKLLEEHAGDLSSFIKAQVQYNIAHSYAQLNRTALARLYLRYAIRAYPWQREYYYFYFWLLFGASGYNLGKFGVHQIYRPIMHQYERFRE